jgi:hypothetical protein
LRGLPEARDTRKGDFGSRFLDRENRDMAARRMSFKRYYRKVYATFGYALTERTAMSSNVLRAAEKRLGVHIPLVLRDYYLVAGQEGRFSACHNTLLPPTKWSIDKKRLIFMAENQSVLWWGVSTRNPDSDDPPVSQGINDEPITWVREHRKCSVFLAVMLHYQAVNDGFDFCGTADAPDLSSYRFEDHGWTYYGEVNSLQAYSRANQVVCLMPPGDAPWMLKWSVLAGGKTKADLKAIADDLGLTFE